MNELPDNYNSLIHYTPQFNNVLGILQNGFKYSTLREDLPLRGYQDSPYSIPGVINYFKESTVICFCDIPFKDIKDHIQQYGEYGIGIKKDWCMSKGISPIRYFHLDTPDLLDVGLMNSLGLFSMMNTLRKTSIKIIIQMLINTGKISEFDFYTLPNDIKQIFDTFNSEYIKSMYYNTLQLDYVRSYKGKWTDRVTKQKTEKIFYYEHEWRSVPNSQKDKFLKFEPDVITHIIINTEEEKKQLLQLYINGIEDKIILLSNLI